MDHSYLEAARRCIVIAVILAATSCDKPSPTPVSAPSVAIPAVDSSRPEETVSFHIVSSILATEAEGPKTKAVATNRFSTVDTIYFFTILGWDDLNRGYGRRRAAWWWYTGDKVVAKHETYVVFDQTPYRLYGYMPAMSLGAGHHKVELYISDVLTDSKEFDITG